MSGGMTVPLAVEAMRQGAIDAVTRPFDLEAVVMPALARMLNEHSTRWSTLPLIARLSTPRSATERWAHLVLKGCEADNDLKTLDDWALFVGVSYSALTEACRMARVKPHDARDFARCLRFLLHSGGRLDRVEDYLDVSDHRTLRALLERAGVTRQAPSKVMSPREFVEHQAFVDRRSNALAIILASITAPALGPLQRS